ncbi:hypothetical protein DF268_27150 [Streptomyces sp. V2]|uniref:Integral membrane protein n=1 Tax=Streptomyces niveiscabiei TaxID=164115 RepID=A0ABW9HXS8_9ACTN|nr:MULTISPECIES: hypothetical protein [Streptomyces]PWG10473.1 hypothetical protein DF268_27150 [Streptomyces sp. V2]
MTGTTSDTARGAGEGSWVLSLLALIPAATLGFFTDLSTPWRELSWISIALSVTLLVAGWTTVFRHGMRGASAWGICVFAHAVILLQVIATARN